MKSFVKYIRHKIHADTKQDEVKDFVVRPYYAEIDAKMARRDKPTVADAVATMCEQGNTVFLRKWKHIKNEETRLPYTENTLHEVAHITLQLAHTPEQELCVVPFQLALHLDSFESKDFSRLQLASTLGKLNHCIRAANAIYLKKLSHHYEPVSRRDTAIFFAAGLYMRQKLSQLESLGLAGENQYDAQQAFAQAYKEKEGTQPLLQKADYHIHARSGADDSFVKNYHPYDMIRISPREMRAIIGVATGLRKPEETDYPERMTAIKAVLEKGGLAPPFVHKAQAATLARA